MNDIEKQLLGSIKEAIHEAVKARMSQGYSESPLNRAIDSVVQRNLPDLTSLMDEAMANALRAEDFKAALRDAFNHKLARVLMSKFEGEIEKRVASMRASDTVRAKITLAIERAISEAGGEK